jgi:hypothetical protein
MVPNGSRAGVAEDGLDLVTVHRIADPEPGEGLAAAVDLPEIRGWRWRRRASSEAAAGFADRYQRSSRLAPFRRTNQDTNANHSPAGKHRRSSTSIVECSPRHTHIRAICSARNPDNRRAASMVVWMPTFKTSREKACRYWTCITQKT